MIEYLRAVKTIAARFCPDLLITFNEPASYALASCSKIPCRIAWMLEYPEFELAGFLERMMMERSASHWKDADWIVAPTTQRMALHVGYAPWLLNKRSFVIHNTPSVQTFSSLTMSPLSVEACAWLDRSAKLGRLRVVYGGAVGNRYALDHLIQAVHADSQTCLLMLGKKHDLSQREIGRTLARNPLGDRFLWVDAIPYGEMQKVLTHADVGYAHYLADTLNTRFSAPGKLYEYLRAGLILLSDDECCLRAEARSADCGAFFPRPATVEGISRALAELRLRSAALPEMKLRSRALFDAHFSLEQQMQPLLAALREKLSLPTCL